MLYVLICCFTFFLTFDFRVLARSGSFPCAALIIDVDNGKAHMRGYDKKVGICMASRGGPLFSAPSII
jgi:hypothetical protein